MDGRGIVLMLAMAGALLGVNCGGSEDNDAKESPSSGGGASNTGGVPCGSTSCTAKDGGQGAPCCISPFESKCGEMQGSSCVEPPPLSPSGCPSLGSGALSAMGCCTELGQCGIDASQFRPGLGCIDLAVVAGIMLGAGDGGGSFDVPSPRPCPNP